MKSVNIFVILLLVIITYSCDNNTNNWKRSQANVVDINSDISCCDIENPTDSLLWLNEKIEEVLSKRDFYIQQSRVAIYYTLYYDTLYKADFIEERW